VKKRADTDDDAKLPMPCTVHEQPKPTLYAANGRRVERAIGYRPAYVERTDRDE
jgi:hypothetical protein